MAAFFGCLYAGVTAVPLYPPRPDILRPGQQPLAAFAADCQPAAVLSTGEMLAELHSTLQRTSRAGRAHKIATDQLESSLRPCLAAAADRRRLAGDAAIHVRLHAGAARRNGLARQPDAQRADHAKGRRARRPGLGRFWLPPYHDLGLIGGILQSTFHGAACIMMSPVSFLQQPFRWLAPSRKYRADTSGGPGFAYDLCVQRITPEQRKSLDLSRWSVALIGAEPIHPDTLQRFSAAFGEWGSSPKHGIPPTAWLRPRCW